MCKKSRQSCPLSEYANEQLFAVGLHRSDVGLRSNMLPPFTLKFLSRRAVSVSHALPSDLALKSRCCHMTFSSVAWLRYLYIPSSPKSLLQNCVQSGYIGCTNYACFRLELVVGRLFNKVKSVAATRHAACTSASLCSGEGMERDRPRPLWRVRNCNWGIRRTRTERAQFNSVSFPLSIYLARYREE